jgi:hypothetical protein
LRSYNDDSSLHGEVKHRRVDLSTIEKAHRFPAKS